MTEVAHKAFTSVAHLATYADLSPVTRRSDLSTRGIHPSRRSNKVFKRALLHPPSRPCETPSREPIARARSNRVSTTTNCSSRWPGGDVTPCAPCCATALFTNTSQYLSLDETRSPPSDDCHHLRIGNVPTDTSSCKVSIDCIDRPSKPSLGNWKSPILNPPGEALPHGPPLQVHCARPGVHWRYALRRSRKRECTQRTSCVHGTSQRRPAEQPQASNARIARRGAVTLQSNEEQRGGAAQTVGRRDQ